MTLTISYNGAPIGYDVPPTKVAMPQRAELGAISMGSISPEDPTAALTLVGHKPIAITESACSQPRLFTGWKNQGGPAGDTTVSDVFVEQMAAWGIKFVFGIPGTSALGIVDAIRKNEEMRYIQVRHEQTAAFMASAYGKLTEHIAACLTVAGPGATNLATGLYDAKLDHSPVLAITGLVKRQLMGPGSFQEIDQHAFFEPICVYNKILMSEDQTTTLATLAIKHALVERGVSHISIPNDLQKAPCNGKILPYAGRIANTAISPGDCILKEAASMIDNSERPVIVAGFGSLASGEYVLEFAKKITAPIVTSFRGKGVVDESEALYVGSHGGIGSTAASELVRKSDLLIALGISFSDMTKLPEKKTVQVDINLLMLGKSFPVEPGIYGSCAEVLPKLIDLVRVKDNPAYKQEISKLKEDWMCLIDSEAGAALKPIRPQYIVKVLNEQLADDAIICLDTGENGWWFGRNYFMKKTQKMLFSGYLGSMGYSLPAAMASQLVFPDRQVACITGDGGFSMVMGDFMTCVKYNLPVKIFLFNNHQLGMIMQEQKVEDYQNFATDLYNCDYAEYAKICGGEGIKVNEPGELIDAVRKALSTDKPVIVDIETDPRRFL